jgi:hypothetical protein
MALNGYGPEQIARKLEHDLVLTPLYYWKEKGINRPGKIIGRPPHQWKSTSIIKIFDTEEYCGDIINFKTYTVSYKNKTSHINSEENRSIFRDVNTPIIDRTTFEMVQQKRRKVRKRNPNGEEEANLFSGLLVCADCGKNMWYHFNQKNPEIKFFDCSNYKGNRGTCPSTHYVRVDFLERVVLGEIRRLTRYANKYETDFLQAIADSSLDTAVETAKRKRRELNTLRARDKELDVIFERLYEDNLAGKISDDRFRSASSRYDDEQAALKQRVRELQAELEKEETRALTVDSFLAIVRKYTRARKLTARMLNELIERIEVYHAEKVDGVHVQHLVIHYTCIGPIEIPEEPDLPKPEVMVNTRKGVMVTYEPGRKDGEQIAG